MDDQARKALHKAENERCSNFDRGQVFHWAERGMYVLKADATAEIARLTADLRVYMDAAEAHAVETLRATDRAEKAEAEIDTAHTEKAEAERDVRRLVEALLVTRQRLSSIAHSEFDGVWSEEDFALITAEADEALRPFQEGRP